MLVQSNVKCQMSNVDKGFTLIEILLSVALIGAISAMGAGAYTSFQVRNGMALAENVIAQSARRAQLLSQSIDDSSNWGIYIETGKVTVFKGASYAARDTDYDEYSDILASINISGLDEIVYEIFTGEAQSVGTITLTSPNNEVREIVINEKGMLEY